MCKKITVALAVLTAAFAFSLTAWAADQGSSTNGAAAEKPAQAQQAGCDKCNLKGAVKAQANTGKTAKQCKNCIKQGKGATKDGKNCVVKKSVCDKKTKDGKPCPTDCDKKADSAKK